jgi:hypothetical protein
MHRTLWTTSDMSRDVVCPFELLGSQSVIIECWLASHWPPWNGVHIMRTKYAGFFDTQAGVCSNWPPWNGVRIIRAKFAGCFYTQVGAVCSNCMVTQLWNIARCLRFNFMSVVSTQSHQRCHKWQQIMSNSDEKLPNPGHYPANCQYQVPGNTCTHPHLDTTQKVMESDINLPVHVDRHLAHHFHQKDCTWIFYSILGNCHISHTSQLSHR